MPQTERTIAESILATPVHVAWPGRPRPALAADPRLRAAALEWLDGTCMVGEAVAEYVRWLEQRLGLPV